MWGFEVKNLSYTYSLFKGNHSMESKIIEYGITLLHKSKVEQTEVISRLTFTFLLTNYNNLWSDLHFPNTFSFFFVSYDITSLENIHPIAF